MLSYFGEKSSKSLVQQFYIKFFTLFFAIMLGCFSAQSAWATDPPVISPSTGVYSAVQSTVSITAEPGATIYYTTNGAPATTSSAVYSAPLSIADTATIRSIAFLSGVTSAETIANIQSDPSSLPVPRTGLSLWLKSEFGPLLSGSNITQWNDLSGAAPANNASQATGSKQAILVSPAINGYPSASFNGSSRNYVLANQLTDLTTGFSIFAVIKPVGTATKTLFASSNAGPSNLVSLETVNTQVRLNAYNATTASNVITPTSSITVGKFQLVDAVHNGAASASISVNGESKISGTVQNLVNTARTQNILGANNTVTTYWNGELAELLVYSRAVTETERKNIQAYFFGKFQLATATATAAPVFSVGTSTLLEPTEVAIAVPYNGIAYFTLTGVNPTTSSPVYNGPVRIAYTQTLKCLIVANGISSSITTATYTLNAAKWPAPDVSDARALQINLQLPTTTIPQ
jgi:hypothetical protein